MAVTCLFCDTPERNYKPSPDTYYICGTCVQLFLSSPEEDRIRAYRKAVDNGYLNKAKAIKMFLPEETINGEQQEAGKVRSDLERKRPLRTTRPSRYEHRA